MFSAVMSAVHKHTNRLAREKSPYLLQHAHNPLDWFAWDEEAFTKARAENKPILLSIGYSTCHWCHVMERESFEDEKIGAFLRENFVSIKVDREERPDVDKIYMTFVQSTTGGGGCPACTAGQVCVNASGVALRRVTVAHAGANCVVLRAGEPRRLAEASGSGDPGLGGPGPPPAANISAAASGVVALPLSHKPSISCSCSRARR
jgi:hypothetical protein